MGQINLKQLAAFVQVADLGSFRRAAERLNTTQPNISARIAGLEDRIGQRLMDRDAGSVRLTPTGRQLLFKARAVLDAMEDFIDSADAPGLFQGVIRLGVTEMIVHSWLGALLSKLRARFPELLVDLTVDLSTNLSDALFEHALDLTLQSGPFSRPSSGMLDLGAYPMVWVAAPALAMGGRVLSLDELAAQPILTHARQTLPFQQLQTHVARARRARLVPSSNFSACLRMTHEGLGVACLPLAMVREELEAGRLERLRYLWVPDDLRFAARFHRDRAPLPVREAARIAQEVSASHSERFEVT
ncbi:MAG TPA: LysR family transcriptional regulator [Rhodobacteraceae bacterium]|nr:LysR family transcriptional regulator [Paracoccaceae bacterium]